MPPSPNIIPLFHLLFSCSAKQVKTNENVLQKHFSTTLSNFLIYLNFLVGYSCNVNQA